MTFIHQADNVVDVATENKIMCRELYKMIDDRMEFDGYVFQIGISMGTATYPFDTENGETLVRYADLAMYNAKKSHKLPACIAYSVQYNETAESRKRIEFLLRTIDYDQEFSLVFQPQIKITDQSVVAAEALLRWNNQEFCVLSPTEFLEIAAETDLIIKIGKWVIRNAFLQISQWKRRFNSDFKICINLSPLQFSSAGLSSYIREIAKEYNINPAWVIFEITETHALNRSAVVQETFSALYQMGFRFSIDN